MESDLGGLRLRNIGPASMSGRVVDMDVVESDPHVMWVASATGGVWRTKDNGVTWDAGVRRRGGPLGRRRRRRPDEPEHRLGRHRREQPPASVGYGDGVYKIDRRRQTWTNVGLKTSEHIGRIVIHPTDPDIVYVAAQGPLWGPGGDRGLYKTTDGGKTWTRSCTIDDDTGVTDVVMDPNNPDTLLAAS